MKSRVSIDVDQDNQPIIKIEYSPSEDVRDKLVKKFLETFEGESCWANFAFTHSEGNVLGHSQIALIRPMEPKEIKNQIAFMKQTSDRYEEMIKGPKVSE